MTTARRLWRGKQALTLHLPLLAGLVLSLSNPVHSQTSRRLENGTLISIRARNQPLSSILSRIEKSSRVKIEVRDVFGRPEREFLSERLTLAVNKVPFWEAVDAIQKLTGLKFKAIEKGSAVLATEPFGGIQNRVTGAPVIAGAFLLTPELDFVKRARIRMRPEPWIGQPYTSDYKAELTFEGGVTVDYEPAFPIQNAGRFTGEILLPIEPKLDDGLPSTAQRLELEATIAFAESKKTIKTAPLSSLLAKPQRFGDKRVVVQRIERTAGDKRVAIDLEVAGTRLLRDDVELVAAGKSVKPVSCVASMVWGQELQLEFDVPATVKLKGLQLRLSLPEIEKKTFGAVGTLEGKTVKAGDRSLKIAKARAQGNSISLEVEVSGGEVFEISLTASDGRVLNPNFSSGSTRRGIQRIRANFFEFQQNTAFGDCKLTVEYPSKAVTRVLVSSRRSRSVKRRTAVS